MTAVVRALVAKGGVDGAGRDADGTPAVVHAASNGHEATAVWLLEEGGATVDLSPGRWNYIVIAAEKGMPRLIRAAVRAARRAGMGEAMLQRA